MTEPLLSVTVPSGTTTLVCSGPGIPTTFRPSTSTRSLPSAKVKSMEEQFNVIMVHVKTIKLRFTKTNWSNTILLKPGKLFISQNTFHQLNNHNLTFYFETKKHLQPISYEFTFSLCLTYTYNIFILNFDWLFLITLLMLK